MSSLIGNDIEAYCTKCRLLLYHIILVDRDNVVSRVKCKTCGSEHNYRSAVPSPHPAKEKKVKSGLSNTTPAQWERMKNDLKPNIPIKIYRTHDTFRLKDVIQHHVFGLGFVGQIISDTRMEVLFSDSIKRMVMNTEESSLRLV
ncbi:MAG: hypothetical protein HY879_25155 [Deltaproteobacteria bacterium]|nr:hypothetical protein [Deltaproteobacteria bacterium]